MSDERNFKQRKSINPLENFNPNDVDSVMEKIKELDKGHKPTDPMQEKMSGDLPFAIEGNVPPQVANMFKKDGLKTAATDQQKKEELAPTPYRPKVQNATLDLLRGKLKLQTALYEEVTLPSLSKFYKNGEAPDNGIIHVRRMTGDEEEILGTQRFLKKGQAINMIFENCVQEQVNPSKWLTLDRTFLLIYLRGISMGTLYDVGLRCPLCSTQFESTVDLDELKVKLCPSDYNMNSLKGKLPMSGFSFEFRIPTVADEQVITNYQDKRKKQDGADDSMTFRLATLLEEIEGLDEHSALMELMKDLPIADFAYLREIINDIPFGIDTKVDQFCPACGEDFKTDMPIEASFFFPKRRRGNRTHASD